MPKKFLFTLILGLCCQGISTAQAASCETLITKCEDKWEADKWKKDPSTLSSGLENVCKSILTEKQMKKWHGILENCTADAKRAYEVGPEKTGACGALVFELHDTVKYKYKDKHKDKHKDKDKDKDKDKHKDKNNPKDKGKDKHKDKHKDKGKEKHKHKEEYCVKSGE